MTPHERVTKEVERWFLLEPLFFSVWTLHRTEMVTSIKTIRVHRGIIEINPSFLDSLSREVLAEVLAFEAMRIVLKHPYSRKKERTKIAYLASNITVQEYLCTKLLPFPSAHDFFKTSAFDKKHFELYYEKVIEETSRSLEQESEKDDLSSTSSENDPGKEKFEHSNQPKPGGEECEQNERQYANEPSEGETDESEEEAKMRGETGASQSEQKSKGQTNGEKNKPTSRRTVGQSDKQAEGQSPEKKQLENYSHQDISGIENANEWDKDEYHEELINQKIQEVQLATSWGSMTSDVKEKILATLKPKINYRAMLKSFRASILSNHRRLTRMKPSRRYGFLYMGSKREFSTRLLFAIDVSGSVNSYALTNAFSIVNRFFKYGIEEISTICFDSEIKGKLNSLKKARKEVQVIGRGGTDFNPVIEFINKDRSYDGLIIFTDGQAPCPTPPLNKSTKIIWLFDSERNYNYGKDALKRLGQVAFIKET